MKDKRRPAGEPGEPGERGRNGRARLGIVIPAHNEAGRLSLCLGSLGPFRDAGDRLVVVDAASADGTGEIARAWGVPVLRRDSPERGFAVAAGYGEVAGGSDIVLVVHADMIVPARARAAILEALATRPRAVGGALGHVIEDPRWRFRLVEWGNRFRARWGQLPYGDQAQFVRTRSVEAVGGFPRMAWLEDLELALRLRRLGPWLYLDCPVSIPARHWAAGVLRTTVRNWGVALEYRWTRSCFPARERGARAAGPASAGAEGPDGCGYDGAAGRPGGSGR